jgi:hypothetical protein
MTRSAFLLVVSWCVLPAAAFALQPSSDLDLTRVTGEVALDDWPFCDFLVVHTDRGFSLVTWQSGLWTFGEGDRVYGPVQHSGPQTILIAGPVLSGEMMVDVEEVGVDLQHAQSSFYTRCKDRNSATPPQGADSSEAAK